MSVFSEDKRFEGLPQKTGLFLLLAVLMLAFVIVAALVRQDVFTQTARLYFFAPSALGINQGMAVQLSGLRIGTVEEMNLEPNATIKVKLVVKSEYTRLINHDAVARLVKEGLIGASVIEIIPSTKQSRPVTNNGVLAFERAGDFAEMAETLRNKVVPILTDIKQITESINNPDGDIRQTIRNVRQTTVLLADAAQQISHITRQDGPKMSVILAKAESAMEKTRSVLDRFDHALAPIDKGLPELLLKLDRSLTNLEAVTDTAKRLSSTVNEGLPPAIKGGQILIEDTREIIDGAKRGWPIRNMLSPAQEKSLPLDSFDVETKPAK